MVGGCYRRAIIPTTIVGQKIGVLKVEDPLHPATKILGASWPVADELRSFYTSLGHRDDIWANDEKSARTVTAGIRWALGMENQHGRGRGQPVVLSKLSRRP